MKENDNINERVGRMADILSQVRDLKELIKVHGDDGSRLMKEQYEYRRVKLLKELRDILLEYEVTAAELAA